MKLASDRYTVCKRMMKMQKENNKQKMINMTRHYKQKMEMCRLKNEMWQLKNQENIGDYLSDSNDDELFRNGEDPSSEESDEVRDFININVIVYQTFGNN